MKYRLLAGLAAFAILVPFFIRWSNEPSWRVTRMINDGEQHDLVAFTCWSPRGAFEKVDCHHRDTVAESGRILSQPDAVPPNGMPLADYSLLTVAFKDGRSARFWVFIEEHGLWIADPNSGLMEAVYPTNYKRYAELSPLLCEIKDWMQRRHSQGKQRLVIAENGSKTTVTSE